MSSANFFFYFMGAVVIIGMIVIIINKIRERETYAPYPIKAQILDKNDKHTKGHAITRGVVGNAVAGPVGAVVGAISATGNTYTEVVFRVWWSNGTETIEKCRTSDPKYKEYLRLIP